MWSMRWPSFSVPKLVKLDDIDQVHNGFFTHLLQQPEAGMLTT